jgi:GAF domain-containing protein
MRNLFPTAQRARALVACALAVVVVAVCAVGGTVVPAALLVAWPVLALGDQRRTRISHVVAGAVIVAAGAAAATGEPLSEAAVAVLLAVLVAGAAAAWSAAAIDARARDSDGRAFLGDVAARLLVAAGDHEATVRAAATLPVPALAEWSVLDVLGPGDRVHRHAVRAHADATEELVWEPPDGYAPGAPAAEVLRTGRAQLWPQLPAGLLADLAHDEDHLAALQALGPGSGMCVPLRTITRTVGVMTVGAGSPGRFGPVDLDLLLEVARRCAVAIDRAGGRRPVADVRGVRPETTGGAA